MLYASIGLMFLLFFYIYLPVKLLLFYFKVPPTYIFHALIDLYYVFKIGNKRIAIGRNLRIVFKQKMGTSIQKFLFL